MDSTVEYSVPSNPSSFSKPRSLAALQQVDISCYALETMHLRCVAAIDLFIIH